MGHNEARGCTEEGAALSWAEEIWDVAAEITADPVFPGYLTETQKEAWLELARGYPRGKQEEYIARYQHLARKAGLDY